MDERSAAEGWYRDPFGIHEDRWISEGRPTKLVRDGGVEATDAPPSQQFPGELVPIPEPETSSPDDLRRADEAEAGDPQVDDPGMTDHAGEVVTRTWPPA
jgi:hypothetical protein